MIYFHFFKRRKNKFLVGCLWLFLYFFFFHVNSELGIVCCLYRRKGQCRTAVLFVAEFAIHVTGLIHRRNKGSSRAMSTLFFVWSAPAAVQTLGRQPHLVVKNIIEATPRFDTVSWQYTAYKWGRKKKVRIHFQQSTQWALKQRIHHKSNTVI